MIGQNQKLLVAALSLALFACAWPSAHAQIAITEVMSDPSRACSPFRGVDYFELTNFGTNAVDLNGYGIHDDHDNEIYRLMFAGLRLEPGQTAVFFRTNSAGWDTNRFREWWGQNTLPTNVVLRGFYDPGLNGDDGGDELWLRDPANNVIDAFIFPTATAGHSFESDPLTGEFGKVTEPGIRHAFRAALCTNDVASPGCSAGPIPLRVTEQPADQTLSGCGTITLQVRAQGLPRPRYQWFKDGIAQPGATAPSLVLRDQGEIHSFYVVISNGLEEIVSRTATVRIETAPLGPIITSAPQDTVLYREQTAVFCVEARGYPCPSYQWQLDGQDLAGETSRCLEWSVPWDEPYGSREVTVRVSNAEGSTNVVASLIVAPRPELRVTEIMAWPRNDAFSEHGDWFELTNFSTNTVNLTGFRFGDSESFRAATTITNRVLIRPGESIIFVDTMTPAQFRAWWGSEHLRPDLQIVTWYGFSLDNTKDEIFFWNPAARHQTNEVLVSASFADAHEGITFGPYLNSYYDESFGWVGYAPPYSLNGTGGAFQLETGDVGSPGYIANPPPRMVSITSIGNTMSIRARVIVDKNYQLWRTGNLNNASWTPVTTQKATGFFSIFTESVDEHERSGFYRLEELP